MKKIKSASFLLIFILSCKPTKTNEAIKIDGSSTVYVLSEAIAEEYQKLKKSHVSIGVSGTGGGFKKLCENRINIIGASREITKHEIELCKKNQVSYVELPVAYDGIAILVNKSNTFINEISTSTLKKLFEPKAERKILTWKDLNPMWPNREIQIFAPGVSSGSYDYFTKAIVGEEHASRGDLTTSEDDNVLVHGIKSNVDAIGFFSFAYYLENKDELKLLAVLDEGKKPSIGFVLPKLETIQSGSYSPLSRMIYIYVNKKMIDKKTKEFLQFYLKNSAILAKEVGFVPLKEEIIKESLGRLND